MIRQASDEGVTEIIGFVLIMGLVAVVLFIMALVVPPMTGAEMEGELMQDAIRQISSVKYDMDLLWENKEPMAGVNRSGLVQLSSVKKGKFAMLPVFDPVIGSATMTVERSKTSLTITEKEGDIIKKSVSYNNLTRLTYVTANNYADNAVVMYDGGAVFFGTANSQSLILAPSVGKSSETSMLIVLPTLSSGTKSVSSNRFGVIEYAVEKVDSSASFTRPTIQIRSDSAGVTAGWGSVLKQSEWIETYKGSGIWLYSGTMTVTVMEVQYSMSVRGAYY